MIITQSSTSLRLVLYGPPRTKKNHGKVVKRGNRKFHVSSDAYSKWNAAAQLQLARIRSATSTTLPITGPVNVAALFYRHADVGDAVGFFQALADALQEGRIVENDRQICQWDGSRLLKDAEDPRVIVTITALAKEERMAA